MNINLHILNSQEVTAESIWEDVVAIRLQKPLIHNITNYVVMDFTANALLALGASPVMVHAMDEVVDMCAIAQALVINIGTLSEEWIESMHEAMHCARGRGTPAVFDPVGAGATPYRTRMAMELIERGYPQVIRGNASEISALGGATYSTKGVDSTVDAKSVLMDAETLSMQTSRTVVVSGPKDYIIKNKNMMVVSNGDKMMSKVTGMGCVATAVIGAFLAVNKIPFLAASHAMAFMGIAGELAGKEAQGPGSFRTAFIDAVYQMEKIEIESHLKISKGYD